MSEIVPTESPQAPELPAKKHPHLYRGGAGALAGLTGGLLFGGAHTLLLTDSLGLGLVMWVLAGAAVGLAGPPLLRWLRDRSPALARVFTGVQITEVSLNLSGLGNVRVQIDDAARTALWPIYVELVTRISANSLRLRVGDRWEDTGNLSAALSSLYGLFKLTRAQLADSRERGAIDVAAGPTVQGWTVAAINLYIRPFLARWHPWLDRWTATGLPEERWPGYEACRADLEQVRSRTLEIVRELAKIYGQVPEPMKDSDRKLGVYDGDSPGLRWATWPEDLAPGWGPDIEATVQRARLAVAARVPPAAIPAEVRALRGLLASWGALADSLDEHLAALGAIPDGVRLREGEQRPDQLLLGWRRPLGQVLATWAERIAEDGIGDGELERCAGDCERTRQLLRSALG